MDHCGVGLAVLRAGMDKNKICVCFMGGGGDPGVVSG